MAACNNQGYEELLDKLKTRFDVVLHDAENSSLTFEWCDGVHQPGFPTFAKDVSDLFLAYLSTAGNSPSAEETADRIDDLIPAEIFDEQDGRGAAYTLWTLVLEVVYHFPCDHEVQDKMAALLHACTILCEEDLDKSLSDISYQWKTIRDLPSLSSRIREIWNGMWPCFSWEHDERCVPEEKVSEERREHWESWLRLNAFVARLLAFDIEETRCYYVEALWTLRDSVLEQDCQDPRRLEQEVVLCSAWIRCAGRHLHLAQKEDTPNEWEARALSSGPLYTGRAGLRQERWEFWHKRFLDIADSSADIDAETRRLARQTAAQMKQIEATKIQSGSQT